MSESAAPAAFVIGGAGTLGSEICRGLAEDGYDVAVGHRPHEDGRARAGAVAAELGGIGRRAVPVALEIGDPESVDRAVAEVAAAFGRLDALVVSSGIARAAAPVDPGDIAGLTPELWDKLMAINVRGPFLAARAAAPHLKAAPGGGRVVLIGSTVGLGRFGAIYPFSTSKAALAPLTRYLAATLAPEVTVNCVSPGLMENTGLSTGASEDFVAEWRASAPLQRTTAPQDVAVQVRAFVRSGSVTGQVLTVDCGLTFT